MSDSVLEKIAAIELEMSLTQKNKATATHLGSLRAKLAKLQRELIDAAGPVSYTHLTLPTIYSV